MLATVLLALHGFVLVPTQTRPAVSRVAVRMDAMQDQLVQLGEQCLESGCSVDETTELVARLNSRYEARVTRARRIRPGECTRPALRHDDAQREHAVTRWRRAPPPSRLWRTPLLPWLIGADHMPPLLSVL